MTATTAPAAPAAATPTPAESAPAERRLLWIDILKGLCILMVLAHHFVAPYTEFLVRLSDTGIADSINQMWSVARRGSTSGFDAVFMVACGLGYHGVHVFLVVSGFSLALADRRRGKPTPFGQFMRRRVARLLPPYWLVVVALGALGAAQSFTDWHPKWLIGSPKADIFVNFFLLRNFSEPWIWIYPGAWWFVPLIVQLYLLYPLLAAGMRRNPAMTLLVCGLITLAYRTVAVLLLDAYPVGTIGTHYTPLVFCLARLFEFAFGMWLAYFLTSERGERVGRATAAIVAVGLGSYVLGTIFATHRLGFILSDPVIGVGLSLLAYTVARGLQGVRIVQPALSFLGRRSYSIFLMHCLLIPTALSYKKGDFFLVGLLVYVAASCVLAVLLDAAVDLLARLWDARVSRRRRPVQQPA